MANYFHDNDDLAYYMDRGVDWDELVSAVEQDFKTPDGFKTTAEAVTFYRDIVETIGAFAANQVAPAAAEIEREGLSLVGGEVQLPPRLAQISTQFQELGAQGTAQPRELGGMHCPTMVYCLMTEIVGRADIAVITQSALSTIVADALLQCSILEGTTIVDPATGVITKTRWAEAIGEIIRGEACGSMDITEANAGSDMAALRTMARQDETGRWRITGEKIFISSGHGKYHFVIARSENSATAPGLAGLSLFFARAYETDATGQRRRLANVERLEHKLGQHASPTCVVTYNDTPADLVGERGKGFPLMLRLMNGARIGVGFAALGIAEGAYRLAKTYAAERTTMGKTLDRHEIIADYLDKAGTDLQVVRALAINAAFHEEMALRLDAKLAFLGALEPQRRREIEARRRHHQHESRRGTPLVKYLAAEKAVEIARRALQILGGVGYTCDYPAERLLRDALAMPIYEGTSQIQALMAMKDSLTAIMRAPKRFVRRIVRAHWRSMWAHDGLERRVARLVGYSLAAEKHLLSKTATDKLKSLTHLPPTEWTKTFFRQWDPKRDFAYASLHAERLTLILADTRAAEVLLAQAQKHPERRALLERHLEPPSRACASCWNRSLPPANACWPNCMATTPSPSADQFECRRSTF